MAKSRASSAPRRTAEVAPAQSVVEHAADVVKPHLRGWLHAGTFPLALAGGTVLTVLAPTSGARWASLVYALSAALLFGVSAIYHRGRWGRRMFGTLKRLDHANIFLIIAGTYTPFAVLLVEGNRGRTLLAIVWTGAILGMMFRVFWSDASRWLTTPVYIALGWVAVFYLGDISSAGGPAVLTLLLVGGGLYSAGGVVYALKRPNPSPRWFGFHEVFHALTLGAYVVHYLAVSMVVYRAG